MEILSFRKVLFAAMMQRPQFNAAALRYRLDACCGEIGSDYTDYDFNARYDCSQLAKRYQRSSDDWRQRMGRGHTEDNAIRVLEQTDTEGYI